MTMADSCGASEGYLRRTSHEEEMLTQVRRMRSVAEYKHRAEECHGLAQRSTKPEDRGAFEEMAQTWELLADLREKELSRNSKSLVEQNHAEECRKLAQRATTAQDRKVFEGMALTWDMVAELRRQELEQNDGGDTCTQFAQILEAPCDANK
jgi:hypothetical protein